MEINDQLVVPVLGVFGPLQSRLLFRVLASSQMLLSVDMHSRN